MTDPRYAYLALVTGTLLNDVIVAIVGGVFLLVNTVLNARILRSVDEAKRIAKDNNVKVTDVHAMADQREGERRAREEEVDRDRREGERRRNADA